jgi:hypothetical protein
MKTKKKTRPLICSLLIRGRAQSSQPRGVIETSSDIIAGSADGVHCSGITGATTKGRWPELVWSARESRATM